MMEDCILNASIRSYTSFVSSNRAINIDRTSSGAVLANPVIIRAGKLFMEARRLKVFAKERFSISAKSSALTSQLSWKHFTASHLYFSLPHCVVTKSFLYCTSTSFKRNLSNMVYPSYAFLRLLYISSVKIPSTCFLISSFDRSNEKKS